MTTVNHFKGMWCVASYKLQLLWEYTLRPSENIHRCVCLTTYVPCMGMIAVLHKCIIVQGEWVVTWFIAYCQ